METQSTSQQEISQGTTPAPETPTVTPETTQATPNGQPTDKTVTPAPETWEYKGDRKDVPKEFEKFVKGLDRYVSSKDQAIAEARKKAEEYDAFTKSEDFKQFQQFREERKRGAGTGTPTQPQPLMTEEEAQAIAVGDAKTLESVIQREVQRKLDESINPKLADAEKKLEAVSLKERQVQSAEMISSFAQVHPDFWDLYDNGLEEYVIGSIKSGRSLEDTYKAAKEIEAKMEQRVEAKRKADFEKKKAGSVAGKSIPGTPDVVFADDEDHAKRLAIELTLKGDKRHVRIKPKK
jgi:hypothetical protein